MRARRFLAALAAGGLWVGAAAGQVAPPASPPPTNPATTPDNTPPRAKPGTGPATQPDNTRPGTAPVPHPPGVALPGTPPAADGSSTGATGRAAVPPELAKLEAQAAVEISAPAVSSGKAPEAKRVAEAAVRVKRATWVVMKLLPPPPDGVRVFDFAGIKVGARGWIDTSADVVKTADGVMVLKPAVAVLPDGVVVGVPVTDKIAAAKSVDLRGEFIVDRSATVDGRDVLVLKPETIAKALDAATARLVTAARVRLEEAKADYANAVAVLAAAKRKATDAALAKASVVAAKQVPVPDNATGEERIKAKRDQDDLARKIAKPDLDQIATRYGDVPAGEPARK